ncbi:hypothetical protein [Streptomyces sulphureus]|uniref:hypothetical protein n=1 Tax=Streptomyces sulphureus TaxID=47758 RepID=UPI000368F27B|nr:hypothetical protein [Streptomyces sulphureus]
MTAARRPRARIPGRRALVLAATLVTAGVGLAPGEAAAAGIAGPCAISARPGTGEGPQNGEHINPLGHRRATMLMVDFADRPARNRAESRAKFFSGYGDEYIERASYGKYRLRLDHTGWIRMPHRWSSYGIDRGVPERLMRRYVRDALEAARERGADLGGTDLVFVVADDNVPAPPTVSQASTFDELRAGGTSVRGAALVFGRRADSALWQRGNFVHEANHLYGLPDLYNVERNASVEYAGGWDTMSMAGISDLLGWHKWKFGWIDGDRVHCTPPGATEEVRLDPVGSRGAKIAVVRTGPHRALVAEARSRTGLDAPICREGVLLYTVDSRTATGRGPVRVVDSRPDSRGGTHCGNRAPAELAELADAPFAPGERHTFGNGARVEVLGKEDSGYRVRMQAPER